MSEIVGAGLLLALVVAGYRRLLGADPLKTTWHRVTGVLILAVALPAFGGVVARGWRSVPTSWCIWAGALMGLVLLGVFALRRKTHHGKETIRPKPRTRLTSHGSEDRS
jgi:hypothetical protein